MTASVAASSSSFPSYLIEQKTAADYCDKLGKSHTIAKLTNERLHRTGMKIKAENPLFAGDLGFRVFKLSNSNIRGARN